MCPETNVVIVEPKKINKKAALVSGAVALALVLGISAFLIYRFVVLQRIPELKRVEEIDVNYYEISVSCYDGKNYTHITPRTRSSEETKAITDQIQGFLSLRGKKVSNWTPDKITYPVYSVTVSPIIFQNVNHETGETVVWSNGYLFTASGDVYKCNIDFKPFMKTDDNDFVMEGELESLSRARSFRPLFYANREWNKELLEPRKITDLIPAEGVEAKIIETGERAGFPLVTILLRNTGGKDWHFEDRSLFVSMAAVVDGELYYIVHDPSIDDDIRTVMGFGRILEAGSEDTVEISLGYFGTLPSGEYKILIPGIDGGEYNYVSVDYHR